MAFQRYFISLQVVIFACFLASSEAYNFFVGGKDGWVLKPSEDYSHWAQRNRFQVNDSLIFKYSKGSDSVLVVDKDDYYNCKKDNPTGSLEDGDSVFKFNRSGPFFFISGHGDKCEKGQKLIIVVLAVWHRAHGAPQPTPLPTPTPAPWVAAHPQPPSQSPSPSPVVSPAPAAGSPQADSPTGLATENAPDMGAPAPAPSSAVPVGDPVGFVVAVLGCFFFGLL